MLSLEHYKLQIKYACKMIIILNLIKFLKMTNRRTCTVTGMKTKTSNFYNNQNHVKAVDNIRRTTGATKEQLTRMFNQLQTY